MYGIVVITIVLGALACSAASSASFDTGAGEISVLLSLLDRTVCDRRPDGTCARGSVQVDPWLSRVLALQRELAASDPLPYAQRLGTHNSFNDRADGYGAGERWIEDLVRLLDPDRKQAFVWAQQEYSMTDQLDLGARALHLDPHYVAGELRLCHGGRSWPWLEELVRLADEVLNATFDFGPQDVGCSTRDRLLSDGLAEIRAWMSANPGELLFVHWDDQNYTFGHGAEVEALLNDTFGSLLLTPAERAAWFTSDAWPSPSQLLARGKSLLVQSESTDGAYSGALIFAPFTTPGWPANCVDRFSPPPGCGGLDEQLPSAGTWTLFGSESQMVGPLYDGSVACGLFLPDNLPAFARCGVSVLEVDQLTPALLRGGAVWSWADGAWPSAAEPCAALVAADEDERWRPVSCSDESLRPLCRHPRPWLVPRDEWWRLGVGVGRSCPAGHELEPPHTAAENHEAWLALRRSGAPAALLGRRLSSAA
jgi:hypothetical protein